MRGGPAINVNHPLHDAHYVAADVAEHLAANLVLRAAVIVHHHTAYYIFAVDLDHLHDDDFDFDDFDNVFHLDDHYVTGSTTVRRSHHDHRGRHVLGVLPVDQPVHGSREDHYYRAGDV